MSIYLNIILELVIVYCAVKVFDVKNPIGSILFLVGLFGSASIYFYIKGLSFMSLSFIIVYVGAISILFVFIIMLLDIRTSEILNDNSNSMPLATMISGFLGYFFFTKVWEDSVIKERNNYILKVSSDNWDNNIIDVSHINSIGSILYTSFIVWLIIISIILLLVMVGAIVITINRSYL